jgi:hypothetical protein
MKNTVSTNLLNADNVTTLRQYSNANELSSPAAYIDKILAA